MPPDTLEISSAVSWRMATIRLADENSFSVLEFIMGFSTLRLTRTFQTRRRIVSDMSTHECEMVHTLSSVRTALRWPRRHRATSGFSARDWGSGKARQADVVSLTIAGGIRSPVQKEKPKEQTLIGPAEEPLNRRDPGTPSEDQIGMVGDIITDSRRPPSEMRTS